MLAGRAVRLVAHDRVAPFGPGAPGLGEALEQQVRDRLAVVGEDTSARLALGLPEEGGEVIEQVVAPALAELVEERGRRVGLTGRVVHLVRVVEEGAQAAQVASRERAIEPRRGGSAARPSRSGRSPGPHPPARRARPSCRASPGTPRPVASRRAAPPSRASRPARRGSSGSGARRRTRWPRARRAARLSGTAPGRGRGAAGRHCSRRGPAAPRSGPRGPPPSRAAPGGSARPRPAVAHPAATRSGGRGTGWPPRRRPRARRKASRSPGPCRRPGRGDAPRADVCSSSAVHSGDRYGLNRLSKPCTP